MRRHLREVGSVRQRRKGSGRAAAAAVIVALGLAVGVLPAVAQIPPPPLVAIDGVPRVLVFSMTLGYRHAVIPEGNTAMAMMGASTGEYNVDISENPQDLTA